MGTGYTRNDTSNNIANGNVIDAADLDGEFDAIATAFGTSGHSHDGTTAEGGAITVVGPTQEFLGDGSSFYPKSDATYDLGKSTASFDVAYVESINLGGTGITATGTELNYTDGVTSNIQTQLGTKLPLAGGTMTGAINMGSNNITTTGKMLFANMYATEGDLPSASTYHGMFAHVHATGAGYFAHGGSWVKLANDSQISDENFTTADHSKLDGIESGATADQTKSDIEGLGIDVPATNLTGTIPAARLSTAVTQAETDDSTKIATTAYVSDKITTLIGGAPSTLNDLNELAAAINDDANYNSTLTTALGTKAAKTTSISAGSGLSGGGDLSADRTISHADTSSQSSVNNSGRTYIQDITLDTYGHITGITSATETVTNTNTTYSAGNGLGLSGTTFNVNGDQRGNITYMGRDTNDYIGVETTAINFVLDGNVDMKLENDGDLHVDGNVVAYSTTTSDERLKKDIVKIDNALDKVSQLNGYTFEYLNDGKKSAGVIAQEVEAVMPSAVSEMKLPLKSDDDQEYKVVQYDQLHGLLIEAIKELKAEIETLKG
jgi:hypothetical protein